MDRIDLYYEVTREKLLNQESLNKEFGTKASSILGLGAALIGAATIILNLSDIKLGLGIPAFWVFIVLVVAFVFTAIFCISVLRLRDWQHSPTASGITKRLNGYKDENAHRVGRRRVRAVCRVQPGSPARQGNRPATGSDLSNAGSFHGCSPRHPLLLAPLEAPLFYIWLGRRLSFRCRWKRSRRRLLRSSRRRYRRCFFGWW